MTSISRTLPRIRLLAGALVLATAAAQGCAASDTPATPTLVTLQGRLVLKGNAPFVVPALITAQQQWELKGLTPEQMAALQNKSVTVTGVASAEAPVPARLPGFSVQTIAPLSAPAL